MADWKKLVVSGSEISQLNNDTGYLTSVSTLQDGNGISDFTYNGTAGATISVQASDSSIDVEAGGISLSDTAVVAGTYGDQSSGQVATFTVDAQGRITSASEFNIPSSTFSLAGDTGTDNIAGGDTITFTGGDGINTIITDNEVTISTVSGTISGSSQVDLSAASGDITLGTQTTGNYVASLGSGTGVTIGSNTGEGSTPTIVVDYGSSANTAVEGDTLVSFSGTANEITIDAGSSITLGSGGTVTIGLADTIVGNRTFSNDVTVDGDLIVNGTATTINTTNLSVEDRFILLNSGSTNPDEGGIVIDAGTGTGPGFIYEADIGVERWGFNSTVSSIATTADTTAYVAAVIDINNANHSDSAEYQKNGNIRIDVSGDIWIYS